MRPWLSGLLACALLTRTGTADSSFTTPDPSSAPRRAEPILRANELAVGPLPRAGVAVLSYDYAGNGLTGTEVQTIDLASGAYIDALDSGVLHTGEGYDGRTPWMKDLSGAYTPEAGGDRVRVAISAAFRNANGWWRRDRAGARLEDMGRESLDGVPADHVGVQPPRGVRFEAWFDARTHLLMQIAEPRMFFKTRTVFSDYRRESGVMLPHRILLDGGTGKAGYEHLTLRHVSFEPARPIATFSCPRVPPTGVVLAHGASSTSVPFRLLNNHIYVEARVNGTGPYTFIVDTGGHTLLSARVISRAKLASVGKAPMSGAGEKESSTGFAAVRTISIGGLEMHDQTAFAAEIYSPQIEGIRVDGMVGFELFRRLTVRIDYEHRTLTFTDPARFSSRGAGTPIPFVFYDHLPYVRGRIDELPASFDIDTGSRSELDVTSPAVVRDRLHERYPRGVRAVTGWGVGGPAHSYVARLHSVSVGPVMVDGPVADFSEDRGGSFSDPNYDANVGSGFLKRFVVTLDYGHQMMYLRRIEPTPVDTGDFDRSGMWINAAPNGYVITSVSRGSPADEAGLSVGEVIVRLDGRPAVADRLSDARRLLRMRPAGSEVPIVVEGKTGARRITVTLRDQI